MPKIVACSEGTSILLLHDVRNIVSTPSKYFCYNTWFGNNNADIHVSVERLLFYSNPGKAKFGLC